MPYRDILYTVEAGIARITLNKPEKLNAATWGTWAEVESAVAEATVDDAVKVVVVTGEGRGFCAGTDLTQSPAAAGEQTRPYSGRELKYRSNYLATAAIYNCPKPTIARVNGASVGAGFSLALACDIRIASEAARFSAIFTKRAIVADTGCTWFLPRLVGEERALELLYTGRMVDAAEALRIGIVSEVVPHDALDARVTQLAAQIAAGPSLAIEMDKKLVREAYSRSLADQIQMEQFYQMTVTNDSEDAREGRLSFLEKRDPAFRGR
ncbi:MAG: enoyl-CoA hydratase/isomerase family protein [Chloroflexi bacterium]|nr:enoyl-CoA hydratase/isomerase family protein [Chloroflexota bacterium]